MKNKYRLLSIILAVNITSVLANENTKETNLEHYKNTRECVNCDLSKQFIGDRYNENFDLTSSNLDGATLSETTWNGNFSYSSFVDVIMTKAKNKYSVPYYITSNFSNSNFRDSNFNSSRFINSNFSSSNFTNVNFKNSDLHNSNFSNCDFTGTDFTDANLNKANFSRANISDNQLKQAKDICGVILPSGDIFECDK